MVESSEAAMSSPFTKDLFSEEASFLQIDSPPPSSNRGNHESDGKFEGHGVGHPILDVSLLLLMSILS